MISHSKKVLIFDAQAFVIAMGITFITGECQHHTAESYDDVAIEVGIKRLGYPANEAPGESDANIVWSFFRSLRMI